MIAVALIVAGGFGAVARFLVDQGFGRRSDPPWGTTIVNASACFCLGVIAGWIPDTGNEVAAIIGVGFLGGYSTFSTAMAESADLIMKGRYGAGIRHAVLMLVLGLVAAGVGLTLGGLL